MSSFHDIYRKSRVNSDFFPPHCLHRFCAFNYLEKLASCQNETNFFDFKEINT